MTTSQKVAGVGIVVFLAVVVWFVKYQVYDREQERREVKREQSVFQAQQRLNELKDR